MVWQSCCDVIGHKVLTDFFCSEIDVMSGEDIYAQPSLDTILLKDPILKEIKY